MNYSHETLVVHLSRPVWAATEFLKIERCIGAVLPEIEGAHCSVAQFSISKNRDVPFGRLRWDNKSFQKWLHNAPGDDERSSDWGFVSLEASVPRPSAWDMDGCGPKVFVSLANYKRGLHENSEAAAALLQVSIGECEEEGDNSTASLKLEMIRNCIDSVPAFRKNVKWAPFTTGGGLRDVLDSDFAKGRKTSNLELVERVKNLGWHAYEV